ncbi:MAG: mannose-1-phosphate guanylyltransferase/mannose-6-phosphate isomerase [Ectothiorhodospiraceae bacterium]|nr:mannose-1-phosphate guanylyltransferase/mannose-6-phosphate isomerase [Ectothiorhodospiraceae bacterium]
MKIQPVILSGGAGTRLWPLSREQYPKQLLAFQGEKTLLQQTVQRLDGLSTVVGQVAGPIIVCNEQHRFLVAEQLRTINHQSEAILLEPEGRNTAPALTVAALVALKQGNDPVLLVMPADHVITNIAAYHLAVKAAATLAEDGALVTFGIVPTAPETGFGYIRKGGPVTAPDTNAEGASQSSALSPQSYYLDVFVEKPDAQTAQAYVDSGEYLWNSGMFVMKASVWIEQMRQFQPDMLTACQQSIEKASEDLDFCRLNIEAFKTCPSDSIDYAVMEKLGGEQSSDTAHTESALAAIVPLDAGWSDLGAWSAIWEVGESCADGNVSKGDVMSHNCHNSLFHSEHRLVAGVGLDNIVVVETADAVMVAHKDHAQDVKKIVERLKADGRSERLVHRQVYRPWGSYEGVDAGERFQVKRIIVNPGAALSLQMHHHRAEHWIVVKGTARVTCGEKEFLLSENQSTFIPIGEKHRLENPGSLPLEIIEVQSGSYLGEDDIVRFEDRYGRGELTK